MFTRYFLIGVGFFFLVIAGAKMMEISSKRFSEHIENVIADEVREAYRRAEDQNYAPCIKIDGGITCPK